MFLSTSQPVVSRIASIRARFLADVTVRRTYPTGSNAEDLCRLNLFEQFFAENGTRVRISSLAFAHLVARSRREAEQRCQSAVGVGRSLGGHPLLSTLTDSETPAAGFQCKDARIQLEGSGRSYERSSPAAAGQGAGLSHRPLPPHAAQSRTVTSRPVSPRSSILHSH